MNAHRPQTECVTVGAMPSASSFACLAESHPWSRRLFRFLVDMRSSRGEIRRYDTAETFTRATNGQIRNPNLEIRNKFEIRNPNRPTSISPSVLYRLIFGFRISRF